MGISSRPINQSLRITTRTNQPRTSSNKTFQEQFTRGADKTLNLVRSAIHKIPGTAALSASLAHGSSGLSTLSKLESLDGSSLDKTLGGDSIQDEMIKTSQELLARQVEVAQATTLINAESGVIKLIVETKKQIIGNFR